MTRIEKYRACAARGMSIGETARLYQVTPSAVRHANATHNLGFPTTGRRQPKRDLTAMRERVEALASQGKTRREISVAMGVSIWTVIRWTRQWDVKITGRSRSWATGDWMTRLQPRLTPEEAEDLKFLRKRRFTYREALVSIRRPDLLEIIA